VRMIDESIRIRRIVVMIFFMDTSCFFITDVNIP